MKKLVLLMIELTAVFLLLIGIMSALGHRFPGDKVAYFLGNYDLLGSRYMNVLDLRTRQSINLGIGYIFTSNAFSWSSDGRLAFVSYRDGNAEIYVWDGERMTNITQNTANDTNPVWSSDGRLAFVSNREGKSEIYVWDGTVLTNISRSGADNEFPAWSADGRLVFVSHRDANSEIYVWNGTTLTNVSRSSGEDKLPVWSVDGRLAFVSKQGSNQQINVWDGKTITHIFQSKNYAGQPAWSMDGRLAFVSIHDLYTEIDVWDGKTITTFPQSKAGVAPKWSTDRWLAFLSTETDQGGSGIKVSDGKTLTDLSYRSSDDTAFAWTADGRLTLVSARNGNWAIYVWDGVSLKNVLQSPYRQYTFVYSWWTP